MSCIVRATVLTNSSDDSYCRVKLSSEGIWNESTLVESVNGIPLKKGDIVFVDISNGSEEPLILGRAMSKDNKFQSSTEGSVLFESSDGTKWTLAFTKNNKLIIQNSDRTKITIDGSNVSVDCDKLTLNGKDSTITGGTLHTNGTAAPSGSGPYCSIPVCPYTGATHIGNTVTGT